MVLRQIALRKVKVKSLTSSNCTNILRSIFHDCVVCPDACLRQKKTDPTQGQCKEVGSLPLSHSSGRGL